MASRVARPKKKINIRRDTTLPGEVKVLIRTSERSAFLTCRQKWLWGFVEQLKPIEEKPALEFGDYVHQALAAYYIPGRKRGPHPAETFEKLVERRVAETGKFGLWSDDEYIEGTELGVGMLEGYVRKWEDKDKEYEVVSSEQVFQVPIGRMAINEQRFRIFYVGTIDGVWRHLIGEKKRGTGKLFKFAEHKTTTRISEDALPMDEQSGGYWTYGPRALRLKGIIGPDDTFDGIIYNFLRKAVPNDEATRNADGLKLNLPKKDALIDFLSDNDIPLPAKKTIPILTAIVREHGQDPLQLGEISKNQDSPYFHRQTSYRGEAEAERVKVRVLQQARDMITARLNPEEHVYKNPGPQFLPNCRFCSFRDICEVHETGHNIDVMIPELYTGWEPYDAHNRVERF